MKRFLSLLNERGLHKPFLLLMLLALWSGNMFGDVPTVTSTDYSTSSSSPVAISLNTLYVHENTNTDASKYDKLYYSFTATSSTTITMHYIKGQGSSVSSDYPFIYTSSGFSGSKYSTTAGASETDADGNTWLTKSFTVTEGTTYYILSRAYGTYTAKFYLTDDNAVEEETEEEEEVSGGAVGSGSETDSTDPLVITLDTEYTYENTSGSAMYLYYKYTATEDATIVMHYYITSALQDYPFIYSDSSYSTSVTTTKGDNEYDESGTLAYKTKSFDVTAGTTYYIEAKVSNNKTSTFYLSAAETITSVEVTSTTPAENSTISITQGTISVKFNTTVSMGTATLSCGDASETVTANYNSYSLLWTFSSIGDIVYGWLEDGTIKAGDELTLTIENVCSSEDSSIIAGTDGTVTLTFLAPALPTTFDEANSTIPEKFLSYWVSGDEDGKMKLVFSADLDESNTPTARLVFGSADNGEGEYYTEELTTCTVSGNTVTVDLTGTLRTPEGMLPESVYLSSYTTMSVKVSNILDANGALILDPNVSGSEGSCSFSLPYEDISTNITTEFDPSSGKVLADTRTSVELWISGVSAVSYSGVTLSYTSSTGNVTSTIAKADLEIEEDADEDYAIITIPLTSAAVNGINLTVELADVEFLDGLEHADASFSATYNEFSMAWVTPSVEDGGTLADAVEKLSADEVLQVSSPVASRIGYMWITFKDETEGVDDPVLRATNLEYNEDNGYWEYTNPSELEFTEGHTYSVTVSARNMSSTYNTNSVTYGEISYTFEGATAAYEYSDYTFVSITPDPDEVTLASADENTFTITFSGPVNLEESFVNYGQGITYPFDSMTAVDDDDNDGYATTWTLVVPTSYMEGLDGNYLDLTIVAVDADGRRVEGNQGEDAQTYFAFSYASTIGLPDVTLSPADGETVASLSTITVSYADGIYPTWWYGEKYIKVYDSSDTEVAHCTEVATDNDNENVITLSETITTADTYTLYIPAGFFYLGSSYEYTSKETTATYTIASSTGINRIATGSELSGDIYTISGMKVDNVTKKGIYIVNGMKVVVK